MEKLNIKYYLGSRILGAAGASAELMLGLILIMQASGYPSHSPLTAAGIFFVGVGTLFASFVLLVPALMLRSGREKVRKIGAFIGLVAGILAEYLGMMMSGGWAGWASWNLDTVTRILIWILSPMMLMTACLLYLWKKI